MNLVVKAAIQRALVNVTKSERAALTVPADFSDVNWPFAARRTGSAGRAGNTVGTYICAGLDCSAQLRDPSEKVGRSRLDLDRDTEEVAAQMLNRLGVFIDAIRAA